MKQDRVLIASCWRRALDVDTS